MSVPIRQRVAAVCYRRKKDEVELLLVRISNGRKWTFPKGHVKSGEPPERAAAREALEEAGVTGAIDSEPVGQYYYPGGSGPDSEAEEPVTAYLLKVESASPPQEEWREPCWFSAERAKETLAKHREKTIAQEHARIIDAALERLRSR